MLADVLSQAIAHHQANRLPDAERLYRVILDAHPQHTDANHNIGVLAVQTGKVNVALPYFKAALEVDPSQGQFWLSYIDALLLAGQHSDAREVLAQGRQGGLAGPALDALAVRADATVMEDEAFIVAVAHHYAGRLAEAEEGYRQVLALNPRHIVALGNLGSVHLTLGRMEDAEAYCRRALEIKPDFADAHYNLGNVLRYIGHLGEAEASYRRTLEFKPDFAEVHSNLGNTLRDLNRLEEAETSYRRALEIKPDYAEAHSNLSNTLHGLNRLKEAEASARRALEIKPNFAEAHGILGSILLTLGRLDEAESSYRRALEIDPKRAETWNNYSLLTVALWFLQTRESRREDIIKTELSASVCATSEFQMHEYFVNKFRLPETEESFKRALAALPSRLGETLIIDKMCHEQSSSYELPYKTVALLHFGRSGTGLLHSLIDDHPEISTIPSIYLRGLFNADVWHEIAADGWSKLPERFARMFEVLFDATSAKSIPGQIGENSFFVGREEGMTSVGERRDEFLSVNVEKFCSEALRLMKLYREIDQGLFFKIIHAAYENAVGAKTKKNTIFYHIHNPTDYALLNFLRYEPETKLLMIIRDPVKSCESWVCKLIVDNDYFEICTRIITMLFAVNKTAFRMHDSVGVRLEDLKLQPKKTIRALCAWMGIKETPSLYEMTAQGKKWWGDPSSPNYDKNEAMSPFGVDSTARPLEPVFSESDQFVLQTLFYPFSVRFGYREPDLSWFRKSLKDVRLQIDDMMDFEKALSKRMMIDPVKFKRSAGYLFLRAGFFARLDVMDNFGDYSDMLIPLDISDNK